MSKGLKARLLRKWREEFRARYEIREFANGKFRVYRLVEGSAINGCAGIYDMLAEFDCLANAMRVLKHNEHLYIEGKLNEVVVKTYTI